MVQKKKTLPGWSLAGSTGPRVPLELVGGAEQISATPFDDLERTIFRTGIRPVTRVRQIGRLQQQCQAVQRAAVGEGIADLRIGNVLAHDVAQRPIAGKVTDLAD